MSRLSQYFTGVAAKRLSAVETDPVTSNQHEFNGVVAMSEIFGTARQTYNCKYLYLGEDETETLDTTGVVTWYDARENHPTRTEYRLYFQTNEIVETAREGDLLLVGKRPDNTALILVVKQGSTFESQVRWLFDLTEDGTRFRIREIEGDRNRQIGYAERTVLEALNIEVETVEENWLEILIATYGLTFPSTRIFSAFARETMGEAAPADQPDATLVAWVNHEEMLFRTLEKHIVQIKLDQGFTDVDEFVAFSLSVHNKRKSRMGYSLENHLEQVFIESQIGYSRGKMTENRSKPDFLFPSIESYNDPDFPAERLTMLGSKSTCKDRWRQVLPEAARIQPTKHLFTLEPSISTNQTEEMQARHLQLVLPDELHQTYQPQQQDWLLNLGQFIELARGRE